LQKPSKKRKILRIKFSEIKKSTIETTGQKRTEEIETEETIGTVLFSKILRLQEKIKNKFQKKDLKKKSLQTKYEEEN